MTNVPFWYIDDEQGVRWAVRVSHTLTAFDAHSGSTIVFTSMQQRLTTAYVLEKEQAELSRYELLDFLSRAKLEAVIRSHYAERGRVAA